MWKVLFISLVVSCTFAAAQQLEQYHEFEFAHVSPILYGNNYLSNVFTYICTNHGYHHGYLGWTLCPKTQCTHDSQCAADECCYYHEGPMIMSKKRQLVFQQIHQGGWCEKHKVQGQWCSGMAKMNGHCECAPGLTCKWIPDPTLAALLNPIKARSMICCGHSECQPI